MPLPALTPTSYHRNLREALRSQESGLWAWYASDKFSQEHSERVRLELLKSTYRLDPPGNAEVYRVAAEVSERIGVSAPVTIYQAAGTEPMNAGLCFLPGEAHVVLTGPVLSRLDTTELRALFGHELAHYRLWTEDEGSFHVAEALVESVAGSAAAPPSWVQLAARHRRYTEIYADRGSLVATEGDLHACVRCLLKVSSGVEAPDAAAYLRQVEEVLEKSSEASTAESHPELFLRAWAMQKWLADQDAAEPLLATRVQGAPSLEALDLVMQVQLARQTRAFIEGFLAEPWLCGERTVAHARLFFPDLQPGRPPADETAAAVDAPLADYFGYVLLDLVTADPDLGEIGVAAAQAWADRWAFGPAFDKLARKELRMTVAAMNELRRQWPTLRDQARQSPVEPPVGGTP